MGHPAGKTHGRSGHGLQAASFRPVTEDDEWKTRPVCRLDGPADSLVFDESPAGQVMSVAPGSELELVEVHRRIDHVRRSPVDTLDALGHEARVGDEEIDARRSPEVLTAQVLEDGSPEQRRGPRPVLLVQVPQVAGR